MGSIGVVVTPNSQIQPLGDVIHSFCVTTIMKIVNNNTNDKQTSGASLALDEDSPYTNSCLLTLDRLPLFRAGHVPTFLRSFRSVLKRGPSTESFRSRSFFF